MSVVSVVCCQVEVSATSWSLFQRSPTDFGGSKRVWSWILDNEEVLEHWGCCAMVKKIKTDQAPFISNTFKFIIHSSLVIERCAIFFIVVHTEWTGDKCLTQQFISRNLFMIHTFGLHYYKRKHSNWSKTSYTVEQNSVTLHNNTQHVAVHQNIIVLPVLKLSDDGSGESNHVARCCKTFLLCSKLYHFVFQLQ